MSSSDFMDFMECRFLFRGAIGLVNIIDSTSAETAFDLFLQIIAERDANQHGNVLSLSQETETHCMTIL